MNDTELKKTLLWVSSPYRKGTSMQKIKEILRAVFEKNCNLPRAQSQHQWTTETKFADLPKTSIYNSSTMVSKYYHDQQHQAVKAKSTQNKIAAGVWVMT